MRKKEKRKDGLPQELTLRMRRKATFILISTHSGISVMSDRIVLKLRIEKRLYVPRVMTLA